jgi:hypothetical protein
MNKKIRISPLSQLLGILALIAFCSVAQAQMVVKLKINGDKLIPTTRGSCAKQPNPPGCVRISGRTNINFNLTGNNRCAAGKWVLDHISLSNSEGGQPGDLSAVAASDFNANADSGRVTPVNKSAKHIMLRDNNSAEYDIWYTVYATCGGQTIDSDPRLENTGTGQ